jgi:hypothetical protein
VSAGYDFELAVRDILPGEELTDDYGTLNLKHDFLCLCEFDECRGVIRRDDPLKYAETWDSIIADAFPLIELVEQPLWSLVKEKQEVELALAGEAPIASSRQISMGGSDNLSTKSMNTWKTYLHSPCSTNADQ